MGLLFSGPHLLLVSNNCGSFRCELPGSVKLLPFQSTFTKYLLSVFQSLEITGEKKTDLTIIEYFFQ